MKTGTRVIYKARLEWGTGEIKRVQPNGRLTVWFYSVAREDSFDPQELEIAEKAAA